MDQEMVDSHIKKLQNAQHAINQSFLGQPDLVEKVLLGLMAGGHVLLEGVPGLGKTHLVHCFAQVLDLDFKRVQFTPDLMPSDLIGTEILEEDHGTGKRSFRFIEGPLFTQLLLADEINRTPPKTQAALLEAMQEKTITHAGEIHRLKKPFFVLATQNPIEQTGVYPLPEAQLDRFMLKCGMGYPNHDDELAVLTLTTSKEWQTLQAELSEETILEVQGLVKQVHLDPEIGRWVLNMIRATRPESCLPELKEYMRWGAGTRAGQALILCSKARALLHGRLSVVPEDVKSLLQAVLTHRVMFEFHAQSEGFGEKQFLETLLKAFPEP